MNYIKAALAATAVAATVIVPAPTAQAATVLATEGLLSRSGKTQTAFNGGFCADHTCRSVNKAPINVKKEAQRLQAAINGTGGDLILLGYSHGGATIDQALIDWDRTGTGVDPSRVSLIVKLGNPYNSLGGSNKDLVKLPATSPYRQLEVIAEFDSVAHKPVKWGWFSAINRSLGRHGAYFDADLNNPNNLVWHDEATGVTYLIIRADVLPMLKWRDWFTSDAEMARLDAKYRPLVEKDYDYSKFTPQGPGADWYNTTPKEAPRVGSDQAVEEIARDDDQAPPQSDPDGADRVPLAVEVPEVLDDLDLGEGPDEQPLDDLGDDLAEAGDEAEAEAEVEAAEAEAEAEADAAESESDRDDRDAESEADQGDDDDSSGAV